MHRFLRTAGVFALAITVLVPAVAETASSFQKPRIAMVVAPEDFTDQEYFDQRAVFDSKGALVRVISLGTKDAISHDLKRVHVDCQMADLRLDQFDALDIVGGAGSMTYLLDNEALRNIITAAVRAQKTVAAICAAPAILAKAGVLRNKSATCYKDPRIVTILRMNGAEYVEAPIAATDGIITGSGPDAAKELAAKVLKTLFSCGSGVVSPASWSVGAWHLKEQSGNLESSWRTKWQPSSILRLALPQSHF